MKTVKVRCSWCGGKARRWWQSPCLFCEGQLSFNVVVHPRPTCETCRLGTFSPAGDRDIVECHHSHRAETWKSPHSFCEQHQDWRSYDAWCEWLESHKGLIIEEPKC